MLINTLGNTVYIFSLLDKYGVIRYTYRGRVCEISKVSPCKYIRVTYGKTRIFKRFVNRSYIRTVVNPSYRSKIEIV